ISGLISLLSIFATMFLKNIERYSEIPDYEQEYSSEEIADLLIMSYGEKLKWILKYRSKTDPVANTYYTALHSSSKFTKKLTAKLAEIRQLELTSKAQRLTPLMENTVDYS